MQSDDGELALLPAPVEIATSLSLFQIEEIVALLAESAEEEGLTPEIEHALSTYLQSALEKRDRVAEFIHYCEGMAQLAKAEVKRLQARQKHFESTAERVNTMVLHVMDYLGVKKLEGRAHTMSKRKCPASVHIGDEAEVPAVFKRVTVTLPLECWNTLLAGVVEILRNEAMASVQKYEETVELKALKEALNLEENVPGADLVVNQYSLQIR